MADTIKRVFHFHANGHALSGLFTRPVSKTIEPQAPTVLPTIGGYGNARVENFRWDHYVHFKAGYSHVAGRDRKSTRLNSSHQIISYAVFCLKKKKILAARISTQS